MGDQTSATIASISLATAIVSLVVTILGHGRSIWRKLTSISLDPCTALVERSASSWWKLL